ncbi:MAG: ATP-binding cassette domain-containing protein, partial [Chitinivibrionales bacterium]|nr:ATP-binding cassette domain-containing protein [Chitinivibrionales bacterium]
MTGTQNYSIEIASDRRTIVQVDNFDVAQDHVTFLFGESGIGKSIVCKAIYGLLDPTQLDITVNGQPYERYLAGPYPRRILDSSFFVFQEPSTHLNPLMRISDQLREGDLASAQNEEQVLQRLWESGDNTVRRILDVFPKPHRPSGGEKQRLLLAMAFKKIALTQARSDDCPTFFVFDEPTGSLDNHYRDLFLDSLLECYARKPFTAIFITHDYSIISALYARHQKLLPRIHFKELNRAGDSRVQVRDFSAEEYLGWLRNATPSVPASAGAEAVLTVEPTFRIFDRTLTIFADKQRSRAVPLTIRRGEMVYVKAPSGVGKTTLAKVIMGLYKPQEMAMTLGGHTVTHETRTRFWQRRVWGKLAGMVFQHADEALNLQAAVREVF